MYIEEDPFCRMLPCIIKVRGKSTWLYHSCSNGTYFPIKPAPPRASCRGLLVDVHVFPIFPPQVNTSINASGMRHATALYLLIRYLAAALGQRPRRDLPAFRWYRYGALFAPLNTPLPAPPRTTSLGGCWSWTDMDAGGVVWVFSGSFLAGLRDAFIIAYAQLSHLYNVRLQPHNQHLVPAHAHVHRLNSRNHTASMRLQNEGARLVVLARAYPPGTNLANLPAHAMTTEVAAVFWIRPFAGAGKIGLMEVAPKWSGFDLECLCTVVAASLWGQQFSAKTKLVVPHELNQVLEDQATASMRDIGFVAGALGGQQLVWQRPPATFVSGLGLPLQYMRLPSHVQIPATVAPRVNASLFVEAIQNAGYAVPAAAFQNPFVLPGGVALVVRRPNAPGVGGLLDRVEMWSEEVAGVLLGRCGVPVGAARAALFRAGRASNFPVPVVV